MPECRICKRKGQPGYQRTEKAVLLGTISIMEASKELGVPYQTAWNHFAHHVGKPKVDELKGVQTLQGALEFVARELINRVKELMSLPVSPANEAPVAKQIETLRRLIETVQKLKGEYSEAPVIKIQQVIMQQDQLISFLLSELNPEDKTKLMNFLERTQLGRSVAPATSV